MKYNITFSFLRQRPLCYGQQKFKFMSIKKSSPYESPNVNKLQPVEIDSKTTLHIAMDADPEEARRRYLGRINHKGIVLS
jgi:hypothetical protein